MMGLFEVHYLKGYYLGVTEAAFYALKRLQSKKRKIVDRRASKSRKIRQVIGGMTFSLPIKLLFYMGLYSLSPSFSLLFCVYILQV